ncbi:MAG: HAD hydrolase family protein [Acidobacteriota bacterium]|nr:HAD hydrolase family protein [Acidobacteriota bacterium]
MRAVGDQLYDREMLELAGIPVVMGNATPGLKKPGWIQTDTNDEEGLAKAIIKYALKRN